MRLARARFPRPDFPPPPSGGVPFPSCVPFSLRLLFRHFPLLRFSCPPGARSAFGGLAALLSLCFAAMPARAQPMEPGSPTTCDTACCPAAPTAYAVPGSSAGEIAASRAPGIRHPGDAGDGDGPACLPDPPERSRQRSGAARSAGTGEPGIRPGKRGPADDHGAFRLRSAADARAARFRPGQQRIFVDRPRRSGRRRSAMESGSGRRGALGDRPFAARRLEVVIPPAPSALTEAVGRAGRGGHSGPKGGGTTVDCIVPGTALDGNAPRRFTLDSYCYRAQSGASVRGRCGGP